MKSARTLLLAPLALAFSSNLFGCSSAPAEEGVGASSQKIIFGRPSTDAQDATVIVIHLSDTRQVGSCTGTLIAPNLVLTARHCVSKVNNEPFACDVNGQPVPANSNGAKAGPDLSADGFYVYTGKTSPFASGLPHKPNGVGKKVFHDGAPYLCSHDLALILLEDDIANAMIWPVRVASDPEVGEKITAIGWGLTEDGQRPKARLQRTSIPILQVGPFKGDFSTPPVPTNDFLVGEAICSGDSGGPAVSEVTHSVIGVVSRGGNGSTSTQPGAACIGDKTRNQYTKTAPFKAIIDEAYAASGHDPYYEGLPDPRLGKGGDACGTNEECRSNLCEKDACVEACGIDDACPEGTNCEEVEGGKACKAPPPPPSSGGSSGCSTSTARDTSLLSVFGALTAVGLVARRRRRA